MSFPDRPAPANSKFLGNRANDMNTAGIGMIGFGEAARAFVSGWGTAAAGKVSAYDIKSRASATAAAMDQAYRDAGVAGSQDPAKALSGAKLVFCLVTADQVLAATKAVVQHLNPGTLWFDGNSCSPGTKRKAAELVAAMGGRYIDTAIMAPVHPKLHRTPLLLAGEHADAGAEALRQLDMQLQVAGNRVGDASSIKMMRSIVIKGIEALTMECMIAARSAGVEEAVIASLQASDPGIDWRSRVSYNFDRMMVHGNRRAAEMREVAVTLRELGLPNRMASATAVWEAEVGAMQLPGGKASFTDHADSVLAAMRQNGVEKTAAIE
jgi:3-hydroxyisobutyrate dehydrogenase-like beta-hydroxyacid dehydrogenase